MDPNFPFALEAQLFAAGDGVKHNTVSVEWTNSPSTVENGVCILYEDLGEIPAGLYMIDDTGRLLPGAYYQFLTEYVIQGGTLKIYYNLTVDVPADPGSLVYRNGHKSDDTTLKAGAAIWVTILFNKAATPPAPGLTSVGLTVPPFMAVTGSPLTANGTIAVALNTQAANMLFAGPTAGTGLPAFRALTTADIPALSLADLGGTLPAAKITGLAAVATGGKYSDLTDKTTFAAPTAVVGLTAIPGTAITWMRSDAAPALSLDIVPTWTKKHTFTLGLESNGPITGTDDITTTKSISAGTGATITGKSTITTAGAGGGTSAGLVITDSGASATAGITFVNNGGALNNKVWDIAAKTDGTLKFSIFSDTNTNPLTWLGVTRSGNTVTDIAIAGAAINLNATTGGVTVDGSAATGSALIIKGNNVASGADITFEGTGSVTPNKAIRARGGVLEILNSAHSAAIATMNDAGTLSLQGDLFIGAVGSGLRVKEGVNAKQGTATLVAGTVTVTNTSVTAGSRIFLNGQDDNCKGALRVASRVVGNHFVITSSDATDSGIVAYQIFEPA